MIHFTSGTPSVSKCWLPVFHQGQSYPKLQQCYTESLLFYWSCHLQYSMTHPPGTPGQLWLLCILRGKKKTSISEVKQYLNSSENLKNHFRKYNCHEMSFLNVNNALGKWPAGIDFSVSAVPAKLCKRWMICPDRRHFKAITVI